MIEPGIGHNQGSMIQSANDVVEQVNQWLKDNPVVETEVQARVAKVQIDRAKLCLKDLKDERDVKVAPLARQVEEIRASYRPPLSIVDIALGEVTHRLGVYISAETRRRDEEAARAALQAREAKFKALEAERLEREAQENAAAGELGVDVVNATKAADDAFDEAVTAERKAIRAQRDTHVKIGGGFSRAISLRNKETLIVEDHVAALAQIGLTEGIKEAILTGARAYRKLHGRLPEGIQLEKRQEL